MPIRSILQHFKSYRFNSCLRFLDKGYNGKMA